MSGIHRSPMNSPHKGPVVWKCFHLMTSSWIVYKGICCNCWMNAYFYAYPVVKSLTHCGPVTLFGDIDFGQHWLRWWLVAWRIQSITRANTDLSSVRSSDIHLRAISPEIPQTSALKIISKFVHLKFPSHYNNLIMGVMASQITSLTVVYSTVYSRRRSKKTSKLRWPVNSPHKGPVTWKNSIWWRHHEISRGGGGGGGGGAVG